MAVTASLENLREWGQTMKDFSCQVIYPRGGVKLLMCFKHQSGMVISAF